MSVRWRMLSIALVWAFTGTLAAQVQDGPAFGDRSPYADPRIAPTGTTAASQAILIEVAVYEVNGAQLSALLTDVEQPVIELLKRNGIELPVEQSRRTQPLGFAMRGALALEVDGKDVSSAFKCVSEPRLITHAGREAECFSGGEFPIPVPAGAESDQPVVQREVGTRVKVKPGRTTDGGFWLDVTVEVAKLTQLDGENRRPAELPVLNARRIAAATQLQPGESLLVLDSLHAPSLTQVVQITPRTPTPYGTINQAPAGPYSTVSQAPTGQSSTINPAPTVPRSTVGITSDAGVTGTIAVEPDVTVLAANQNIVELSRVRVLGLAVGQLGVLLRAKQHDLSTDMDVHLVAQPVVARKVASESNDEDSYQAVTLVLSTAKSRSHVENVLADSSKADFWILVPLPDRNRGEALTNPRRLAEHASARAEADGTHNFVEVAAEQRIVRVPSQHNVVLLLPHQVVYEANATYVVSLSGRQGITVPRIGPWEIEYISPLSWELETLLRRLEPTSSVTVIEVRDAALLRGSVVNPQQAHVIKEIAEQFFPKVVDQLQVVQNGQTDVPAGFGPVRTLPAPARGDDTPRLQPTLPNAQDPRLIGPPIHPSPRLPVPALPAEPPRTTAAPRPRVLTPPAATAVAPHELPSAQELRQFRDEVRALRNEIQRLSEQLENWQKSGVGEAPAGGQDAPYGATEIPRRNSGTSAAPRGYRPGPTLPEPALPPPAAAPTAPRPSSASSPPTYQAYPSGQPAAPSPNEPRRRPPRAPDGAGAAAAPRANRPDTPMDVRTYPVADLVVPLASSQNSQVLANAQPLIDLIRTTIAPSEWEANGGTGRLELDHATLGLVVVHRGDIHDQIAELLQALRRVQDTQIVLEASLIQLSPRLKLPDTTGIQVISRERRDELVKYLTEDPSSNIDQQPKYTLFNGQSVMVGNYEESPIVIHAETTEDGLAVRLRVGLNGRTLESSVRQLAAAVKPTESMLFDMTHDISPQAAALRQLPGIHPGQARELLQRLSGETKPAERMLMLLTPTILRQEEQTSAKPSAEVFQPPQEN